MKVGLYFGSFNPIHVGHLIIANYMVDHTDLDQVWFVVSPHNPHKDKKTLLADHHRLALVKEAVDDNPKLRASDIEFGLEQPSYTSKTLAVLSEQYPDTEFSLLMGEDNLRTLHKWYNYDYLLTNYRIFVYPRVFTLQELANREQETNELHQIGKSRPESSLMFAKLSPDNNSIAGNRLGATGDQNSKRRKQF